jgi:hypothetical protein
MNDSAPLLWISTCALLAVSAVWLGIRLVGWAKNGTTGSKLLVSLAFPDPERPPPQEQVEDENRVKKEAESGDPGER